MKEIAQQVIDYIRQASPFLWHAAYRQAITDGIVGCLCGIVLMFLVWPAYKATAYLREENSDAWALPALLGVIACIVGFTLFCVNVEQLINPDYAAVKQLIDLMPAQH